MMQKFRNKMLRSKKGFSLVEIIVVVVILGILAAIVTPSILDYITDSKTNADAANAKSLENAVKRAVALSRLDFYKIGSENIAKVQTEIKKEINPIPTVQAQNSDSTKKFYLTVLTETREVAVTISSVTAAPVASGTTYQVYNLNTP